MEAVAARGPAAVLDDPLHSPAYPLYLGALRKVLGHPERAVRAAKLLAWAATAAACALLVAAGEAWAPGAGWTAAVLLAWSWKWLIYSNVLQYETLAGLLLLLAQARPRARLAALAAACALHPRFLLCWLAGAGRRWRWALPAAALVALALAPGRDKILFQAGRMWRLANNPAAEGYPLIGDEPKTVEGDVSERLVEPSGWSFVARKPLSFLGLTGERFLYLWDVKRDYWTAYDPLLYRPWRHPPALALLQTSLLGLFVCGAALRLRKKDPDARLAGALLAAALLPPLLSFGSSRYLVSALPLVCLFQAYGLVEAARICKAWVHSPRRRGPNSPSFKKSRALS